MQFRQILTALHVHFTSPNYYSYLNLPTAYNSKKTKTHRETLLPITVERQIDSEFAISIYRQMRAYSPRHSSLVSSFTSYDTIVPSFFMWKTVKFCRKPKVYIYVKDGFNSFENQTISECFFSFFYNVNMIASVFFLISSREVTNAQQLKILRESKHNKQLVCRLSLKLQNSPVIVFFSVLLLQEGVL